MSVRLLFQVTEKKEIINQSGGSEKMGSVTLYPKYPAPARLIHSECDVAHQASKGYA